MIDPTYLPFSAETLKQHFLVSPTDNADHQLQYYLKSADQYHAFLKANPETGGISLGRSRRSCQIERDERFWIATSLMAFFHNPERIKHFSVLLQQCFGERPPLVGMSDWKDCLTGQLHLYFELNLPPPLGYKHWLSANLKQYQTIPYRLDAARKRGTEQFRKNLEGSTQLDALLLNETNGFAVLFEAKVLSDISAHTSYHMYRNQIARTIDVMLEANVRLGRPRSLRDPECSLFVLITPEMFRQQSYTRLYGWLMNEYKENPRALARDLPHRESASWPAVAQRMGWLTWEDCEGLLPGSCRWLAE